VASVVAGAIVSMLGRPGMSVIEGEWIASAGVLALTMFAVASLLAGLNALLGHAGLALGAMLMVLVGNPWAGVTSAPELLPSGIGLTGQLLPPGAGGNLLRSTAFFDGAAASGHLAVLLGWGAIGLAGIWAGTLLQRRRATRRQPALAHA
jgi:hypothetical protein